MMKLRNWFLADIKEDENSAQTVFRMLGNLSRWSLTGIVGFVILLISAGPIERILDSRNPIHKLDIEIKYLPQNKIFNPVINFEALRARFPSYSDLTDLEFVLGLYERFGEGISEVDFVRAVGFLSQYQKTATSTLPEGFVLDDQKENPNPFDRFDSPVERRTQALSEMERRRKVARLVELRIKKQVGDGPWWNYAPRVEEISKPSNDACPSFIPLLVSIENKSKSTLQRISLQVEARREGRSTNILNDKKIQSNGISLFHQQKKSNDVFLSTPNFPTS